MEEIVLAVLAKIAEYTVQPVGRWLCYSCHYKSNMEHLKNQEMMLRDAQKEVERKVKTASDNGDQIKDNVETWLKKVDEIIKKLGGGEEEGESRNSNPSCLNLKQRHQMSREAKEMVDNIAELLKMENFVSGVSHRLAAQDRVTPINMDYMTLDSRISITKRIMEALGDANINKIGVWGSPGVGKSTLMKEIFRKAKEESLFDEVALANVTKSPNLSQIQEEIANMLDLKLDPNCKTEMVRAAHLRARLEKDKEKKILVILDDIWKRLDLEEIGIIPSERCKVLLTSRDRHVLASEMVNEENSFKLDTLGEEEAWNLFEKMAGDFAKDDLDLRNTAIEVAKACGGLPIALVTVSRALKNKNSRIWKDALLKLTKSTPEHDTEIWSPVYSCIQLSYKHLDGRELKSLFLLCARQGYYISYRDLLRYGFGLCLFCGIDTLDGARNRLEYLVSKLQDACLLLQSPRSSEEFYMHDVVRHVATMIASNDDHNMFVMRGDGG
ncbi:disease resistance protein At4g27190-like [Juglans regia]|uniref:Disease resistance protein At4g27190-like n=1 Tax=Juglans regia TaxID=51240 RepID=A0A6P9F1U7_JUGRE|nr:disease resistance protein At4g27190-like [Juglans regia]